jgi:hypothetical protein
VPRIGSGPIDDALKELLASSPVSFALRVRSVISSGFAQIAPEITDVDPEDLAVERLINELVFEEISNASLEYPTGSLGESRPLALPLVDESDPAVIDAILNGQSPGAKVFCRRCSSSLSIVLKGSREQRRGRANRRDREPRQHSQRRRSRTDSRGRQSRRNGRALDPFRRSKTGWRADGFRAADAGGISTGPGGQPFLR